MGLLLSFLHEFSQHEVKKVREGKNLNLRRHVGCFCLTSFVFLTSFFFFSRSSFPHQTSNSVYEIVSDMSARQDTLEERLSSLEDKLQGLQVST